MKSPPWPQITCWLFIIFLSQTPADGTRTRLYIWQVGQGLWVTMLQGRSCFHIDMGGERAPLIKIRQLCQNRRNFLFLSHGDLDHISFVKWGIKNLPDLCLVHPLREKLRKSTRQRLTGLVPCPLAQTKNLPIREISFTPPPGDRNSQSRVYTAQGQAAQVVLPGDSTTAAEQVWSPYLLNKSINILVLGHHGSRTSSSAELLNRGFFKMAVASARKNKYGHPHPIVQNRLVQFKISLLTTQAWGNLIFEL